MGLLGLLGFLRRSSLSASLLGRNSGRSDLVADKGGRLRILELSGIGDGVIQALNTCGSHGRSGQKGSAIDSSREGAALQSTSVLVRMVLEIVCALVERHLRRPAICQGIA
jgi:hypothetical protein